MLRNRIISSSILILIFSFMLWQEWLFSLLVILFTLFGLYEFFTMLEAKDISIFKYFGIGIGVIIPFSIAMRFEITRGWEFLLIIIALLFLILMQFKRRENSGVVVGISTTVFGILYVSWFLSFLIKIRQLENGIGLVATLIIISKSGDIGAYFVGRKIGKTLLLPRVSPNKTVEGAAGGLFVSIVAAMFCKPILGLSYLHLMFMGALFGTLAQLGDLSESLMKRDCQVKDSGTIIPGIGGALDLIDSLLFSAPVFYLYIALIHNKL